MIMIMTIQMCHLPGGKSSPYVLQKTSFVITSLEQFADVSPAAHLPGGKVGLFFLQKTSFIVSFIDQVQIGVQMYHLCLP